MESGLTSADDGKLTVLDLVSMFEASEESSQEARRLAERDRDYHDNLQLTKDELDALKKRGQPAYIDNRIKTKVDYLVGLEKQQRINPIAKPRTPQHEDEATSASQALNYVADKEQFDNKRSAIWRNLLIEGAGGMSVRVKTNRRGEVEVCLRRVPWDRMFWDPASAEVDFSDAGYLGTVQWMDYDEALRLYPDGAEALDATLAGASVFDTYDDKPKWHLWADKKRRRVRICSLWLRRGDDWHFAEFTKGGILKAGPSPYVTDTGESDCELVFQSAYVDRENNRFGLVREMISPQDAINKRNSKALHLLNTSQIVVSRGAVDDVEKARREAARPDGVIEVNPISDGGLDANFQFNTRSDLAEGQVALLQEAKQSIDLKGPNATQMGEKTAMGSASASGKAILASQQGGMVSLGDLLDNLRHLDVRVFRAIWNRIRQFWTGEKWLRVTDDEESERWVGVNIDPAAVQMLAMQNPEAAQKIAGVIGNVAELDCDIIVDSSPIAPQMEQYSALIEAKKAGVMVPDKALVRSMPNFPGKQAMLKEMDQPNPMQQQAAALQLQGAEAENRKTMAETAKIMAETQHVGGDPAAEQQARTMEMRGKAMDTQARMAATAQKARADQVKAGLDIEGKRLDLVGKRLDIQRQREAPKPGAQGA